MLTCAGPAVLLDLLCVQHAWRFEHKQSHRHEIYMHQLPSSQGRTAPSFGLVLHIPLSCKVYPVSAGCNTQQAVVASCSGGSELAGTGHSSTCSVWQRVDLFGKSRTSHTAQRLKHLLSRLAVLYQVVQELQHESSQLCAVLLRCDVLNRH